MDPSRFVLADRQWLAIDPLCPGGRAAPGRTGSDAGLFLEAVLRIVRPGATCRLGLAIGIAPSGGSAVGFKPMYSNEYS